jgi:serine/threonine-protein kinase
MPLSAGEKLGVYEILAPLGSGGMGEVWKARDTRLERLVAIKRLKGPHTQRFEQEARSIAALNHPHICQIYDIGPDYLVLEYVEGAPLKGPLPVEEAVRLALQIASALEEAHSRNILHRDLKPGNIMVTVRGSVKLLDFGLAKLLTPTESDVTRTLEGTVMGTVAYMAPEQAEGLPLDARSDIFSFGAVLYEMLAGARAFSGGSTAQVVSAVLRDHPRPLQAPVPLERIVRRCLAKDPGQRFQNIGELKAALEQISAKPAEDQPSIAVLPFANMSASSDDAYFSEGLAEEIINALAHIRGLKVTARTSAFAFQGQKGDIRKIADTLGVRTILEGSVRRAGNRIRVTAQLINAADGYHLWSERYDRDLTDVFAVQDEIAAAIAGALQVKLSPETAPQRRYKPSLAAYEALLRARHFQFNFPSPQALEQVREHFEQAIALDPEFAQAHSELGFYFLSLAGFASRSAAETMPLVRAQAGKALELDPSLPDAHAMLGVVAAVFDYDWKEAERHFRMALSRDAVPPTVHLCYASFFLMPTGRLAEAMQEYDQAVQEDPLNHLFRQGRAGCLLAQGRDAEAVRDARRIIEIDQRLAPSYLTLALAHLSQDKVSEAFSFAEQAYSLAPWYHIAIGLFAALLVRTGDRGRAETVLQGVRDQQSYGAPVALLIFHSVCGEIDAAADWVAKAIAQRFPLIFSLLRGPIGKSLRSSPHWPGLLKLVNL